MLNTIPTSYFIEFAFGLFIWWIAVYLIAQSPLNRIIQLIFGIFSCISVYLSTDIFFAMANVTGNYVANAQLLKSMIWTIYLPSAFLYHASTHIFSKNELKKWQIVSIYFFYLFAFVCIGLERYTSLTRNYSLIGMQTFNGDLTLITGKYFWVNGVYLFLASSFAFYNFFLKLRCEKPYTYLWNRYFWPMLGLLAVSLMGPIIILSYYRIVPHSTVLSGFSFLLLAVPILYSVIKYNLFISESKVIFGKNFVYSTVLTLLILLLLFVIFAFTGLRANTVSELLLPYVLLYFVVLSHPVYNWLVTFANDLTYNKSMGLSLVNDQEVMNALKNFRNPENLESSPLLRLNIVSSNRKGKSVDNLQEIIEQSIEFFKPKSDPLRRTKHNLKYHLLKMLAYDEAEEGQILWELGFEEYPVRIMTNSSRQRPPLFETKSPSDYFYASRNAYLALKKEAIHDITWRISYLEKQEKRNIFKQ